MKHKDFIIGKEFFCGRTKWCCTDKGVRTICAIELADTIISTISDGKGKTEDVMRMAIEEDFNGPPYGVVEVVFDEYDFASCEQD